MEKLPLSNKLKAEHKTDKVLLKETPDAGAIEKELKYEHIKKRFAQDAHIYQRIKCPVMALVCCLMHQV